MASLIRNLFICLGFLVLLATPSAWACSCAGSNPPCQAAWEVSAVFTGTVIDVAQPSITAQPSSGSTTGRQMANAPRPALTPPVRTVRLQLGEVLNGVERDLKEVEVVTGMGGGDCGYGFQVGEAYVVYAYRNSEGRLSTGICSRTRPLKDAAENLAYMHAVGAAAAVIYFSDEAEIQHFDLMLPDRQSERLVEGTVLWPDGRPAAGALLLVMDPRWLWQGFVARATADVQGHFVLPGLFDGTPYRLHATLINPPYGTASAEPVDIQTGKNPLNLRLILSRPDNSVSEDQRKGTEQFRNKQ